MASNGPQVDVAIVGGGFCGTLTAIQILRQRPGLSVMLIEKNRVTGPGLAYGTSDADHLLNVRAGQMGAFPDDIGHFHRWLAAAKPASFDAATDFVPRQLYGHYLRGLWAEAVARHPGLVARRGDIKDIERRTDGFDLSCADGGHVQARQVVLALGNFPPEPASGHAAPVSPYDPATWAELAEAGDVLIVGTGLTSLDLVITLARTKAKGSIHLLSRHGLLPREHAATVPHVLKYIRPTGQTALQVLCAVRREVAAAAASGINWQSVVDALRPHNQTIWAGWPDADKRRFLRHLRSYWDVHRHRCAPQIMNVCRDLQRAGRLFIHHGRILAQTADEAGRSVTWRPRGATGVRVLKVRHCVSCTGPQSDVTRLANPLVQALLARGLITPDALRLGIATTDGHRVTDPAGAPVTGLYALGSPLKGMLYESVAVPELRGQAESVAKLIAAD